MSPRQARLSTKFLSNATAIASSRSGRDRSNADSSRLMVESVAHQLVGESVFVLIPMVTVQRAVNQRCQDNQGAEEQNHFHG
jgi:hypothetical protein